MSAVPHGAASHVSRRPAGWMRDTAALPRPLADLVAYARAVVTLQPDGTITVHENDDPKLHVVAIFTGDGELAAELSYRPQAPYGRPHVGPQPGARLFIPARRPTATLTSEQAAVLAPVLSALLQCIVDDAIRTGYVGRIRTVNVFSPDSDTPTKVKAHVPARGWRSTTHCVVGARLTGGRKLRSPSSRQAAITIERGILWRVAERDRELLTMFELQTRLPQPRLEKALAHVARVLRAIASYERVSLRRAKLAQFFNLGPNGRWLRSTFFVNVLHRIERSYAQRILVDLEELDRLPSDSFSVYWSSLREPNVRTELPLGTLRVRQRPSGKNRGNGFRIFEALATPSITLHTPSSIVEFHSPLVQGDEDASDSNEDGTYYPVASSDYDLAHVPF